MVTNHFRMSAVIADDNARPCGVSPRCMMIKGLSQLTVITVMIITIGRIMSVTLFITFDYDCGMQGISWRHGCVNKR